MTEQQKQTELELASMALISGHFSEAEDYFLNLIREDGEISTYWSGLGQARYGQIISGERSFFEVFHCFEKAKELSPFSTLYIEGCIVESSTDVLKALYQLFFTIHHQKLQLEKRASNRFLTGLGSAYLGSNLGSRNVYGSIIMAYTTIVSIEGILHGRETLLDLKMKERELTGILDKVRWNVERHVTSNKKEREAFFKESRELQQAMGQEVLRNL